MGEMLYKATMEGNTESLLKLIQEDPLILDRVNSITTTHLETPLHIAAMLGHERFVIELLTRKPGLARELDSRRSTALHLASAKGHVGIAKALLRIDPDTCFVCDRDGRNPLHVAAMMGRVDALKEMLLVKPDAARVEMKHGGIMLHLCVEYCQFEALKIIMEKVDFHDLVNSKDRNGNTSLHLAVADKQVETTEFLLSVPGMDLNAVNLSGMTAMDILIQRGQDVRDLEMEKSLKRAGATGGERNIAPFHQNKDNHDCLCSCKNSKKQTKNKEEWIDKKRNALMVVASLIATMAFQVGVNPQKEVWQTGTDQVIANSTRRLNNTNTDQTIGDSTQMSNHTNNPNNATFYPLLDSDYMMKTVEGFYIWNTMSFISSLTIVLLLMSGLPLKSRFFVWILLIITWNAISAISFSYAASVNLQTPPEKVKSIDVIVGKTITIWNYVWVILLILHTVRILWWMVKKFWKMIKLLAKCLCGGRGSSASARHANNSRV